ncbi:MAG: PorP/SprF family type IX secretion system membrane protein [Ferruginibacter sp.]
MKNLVCKMLLFSAVTLFARPDIYSQDIHFSQVFETPLLRNPSLAGLFSGDVRVQSVFKTQWNSVTKPYQTVSMNAEFKLPVGQGDDFLTIGGQVVYDKAGTIALTTTQVLPVVNYHKSLGSKNTYLSMGFMGGYIQRSFDFNKMTTNSQFNGVSYDENIATGETSGNSVSYIDGSAGISFNSQIGENEDNNFYAGIAYHHFNKPTKISFYQDSKMQMEPKWVSSAGIRMNISGYSYFTLEGDHSRQGSYAETIGGALYSWKLDSPDEARYVFHAGAYLRWKDALIPVAKMECKPLAIAVSYDMNISQLKSASNSRGGFEISLTYQKYNDRYNTSRDAVRCPRF